VITFELIDVLVNSLQCPLKIPYSLQPGYILHQIIGFCSLEECLIVNVMLIPYFIEFFLDFINGCVAVNSSQFFVQIIACLQSIIFGNNFVSILALFRELIEDLINLVIFASLCWALSHVISGQNFEFKILDHLCIRLIWIKWLGWLCFFLIFFIWFLFFFFIILVHEVVNLSLSLLTILTWKFGNPNCADFKEICSDNKEHYRKIFHFVIIINI